MTRLAIEADAPPAPPAPAAPRGAAYHWVRIRRFLSTYGWLAREGLLPEKSRIIAVTVASVLGGAAQGAAIGLIVLFVRVIDRKPDATPPSGASSLLGNNLGSLIAVAAALVAMQGFAAYARYYSARHARRIARNYHDRAAASALALYATTTGLDAAARGLTAREICGILARQPRIMGRALEAMVRSINPLCSLAIAGGILVTINLTAALVVAPVLLLMMPILYRVSHRIQRHANAYYETTGRDMARGVPARFDDADTSNVHPARVRERVAEAWATDPRIRDGLEGFDHVLLSVPRSTLATSIFRPVAIGVVLLVLGYQALDGQVEWALLLAFVAALGQVAGFLEMLSGNLAQMNKFYRRVASHRELVDAMRGAERDADPAATPRGADDDGTDDDGTDDDSRVPDAITLTASGTMTDSVPRLTWTRGAPLLCVNALAVCRATLAAVTAPLAAAGTLDARVWRDARFMAAACDLPPGPIAAGVLGTPAPTDDAVAALAGALRELGLGPDLDALPDGLATTVAAARDAGAMPPALATTLKVLSIGATPAAAAPVVLIDRGVLRGATHDHLERLLARLDDRLVVLLARDRGGWAPGVEQVVAVVDDQIVGMGTLAWWQANKDEWTPAPRGADADDDDDDEEDL